ncbi:MAG: redox-sensing transcriptional repressor Rex [Elusimicrobiaceae bacterium]|jgi:redox-sensing transcriptional repressor
MQDKISCREVERFLRYRQFLLDARDAGKENVFSHELAAAADISPEQVRRDIMLLHVNGRPQKGYPIKEFLDDIELKLIPRKVNVAMVGVGNLGRAVLAYFTKRRPNISIVAAFDSDPEKIDRVISGCKCYHIDSLAQVAKEQNIVLGIIAVPASYAQKTADLLVTAGVKGIVNFAPANITVGEGVYLEKIDITTAIEKTAYFANTL